jgi:hypothetical protein
VNDYDPNRIGRGVGYLAMWTTVLWPMVFITGWLAWPAGVILGCIAAIPTMLLMRDLRFRAQAKGYHPAWGWFALGGIIGLLVIFALPDRSADNGPRGFEVQHRSDQSA